LKFLKPSLIAERFAPTEMKADSSSPRDFANAAFGAEWRGTQNTRFVPRNDGT
jgi:hypothetical protein